MLQKSRADGVFCGNFDKMWLLFYQPFWQQSLICELIQEIKILLAMSDISIAFTSAPASIRSLQQSSFCFISTKPSNVSEISSDIAKLNGVQPLFDIALTFAPCSINRDINSGSPFLDAQCSGVSPFCSTALTSAPCARRSFAIAVLPNRAARWRGVLPRKSVVFTSEENPIKLNQSF